jgi:hypothetical protein
LLGYSRQAKALFLIKNKIHLMRHVWNRLFNLTGFRGKTMWDWLRLLFKKQRENKRADVLLEAERERADARIDATQQQGQSEDSSHLAVENALLRELVETQRSQLQVLQEELEAKGRDIQELRVLLQRSQDHRA